MKLSNVRLTHLVAALAVSGLALTACGGDDEEGADDTAPAADADAGAEATADGGDDGGTATADEGAAPTDPPATADEGDDEDVVTVDDIDDIPQECIDQFGELMEQIEPIVEGIDWESATMADFESISTQLDEISEVDTDMGECERYDFEGGDAESLEWAIEIAEERAPGVVPYLQWISDLAADFSAGAGAGSGDAAADIPADCEGAIAYMEGLMDEFSSMSEISLAELTQIGNVTGVIGSECSLEQANEFFSRQDVQDFMSG
jgi:hypothetical protein